MSSGNLVQHIQRIMEANLDTFQRDSLNSMRTTGHPYLVFGDDELSRDTSPEFIEATARLRLLAVTNMIGGRNVSYLSENSGKLIRNVQPLDNAQVGSHGRKDLPLHTDMGYLRFPAESDHQEATAAPDFLVLSCVSNPTGVGTQILSLAEILKDISTRSLDVLRTPAFYFGSPDSVTPSRTSGPCPVIYDHHRYGSMMRWERCTTVTDAAKHAVAELRAFFVPAAGTIVNLEPHQTLLFNNRTVVHGRGPIPDAGTGGGDRHLVRIYIQRSDTEMALVDESNSFLQKG